MVAGLGLFDLLEVLLEVVLGEESGAVDPGQHLSVFITAPVGPGDRVELDRLDPLGSRAMGSAAEVFERAVAVERDGLDAFVGDQVFDQLDFVVLALFAEDRHCFVYRQVATLELLVGLDVAAHCLFDRRQLSVGDPDVLGKLEVVITAVVDRRADGDLGAGVELLYGGCHHMGGVVADHFQTFRVAGGDDCDLLTIADRSTQVAYFVPNPDRQSGASEAFTDRQCGISPGSPGREFKRRAIGQPDRHLFRAHVHPAMVVSQPQPTGSARPSVRPDRPP